MANKQQNTERPNPLLQVGLKPKPGGATPSQVRTVTREEEPPARAYPYPDEEQELEEQPGARGRELKSDEEKATDKKLSDIAEMSVNKEAVGAAV